MSSKFVRDEIMQYLNTEFGASETIIDLTGHFLELEDVLNDAGISHGDPWLGVQFIGGVEVPVDIGATNQKGKYREQGAIFLHIVDMARLGVHNAILNRAEVIRNKFRGQRIGVGEKILIEGVSPANFGEGITLSFTGGYTAAVVQVDYQRDLDL